MSMLFKFFGLILVLFILTYISLCSAWCVAWKEGGAVKFCKNISDSRSNCDKIRSEDECQDLEYEDYAHGFTNGEHQCVIYKKHNCDGAFVSVEKEGWGKFPFNPKSFKCPCVPKDEDEHKKNIKNP